MLVPPLTANPTEAPELPFAWEIPHRTIAPNDMFRVVDSTEPLLNSSRTLLLWWLESKVLRVTHVRDGVGIDPNIVPFSVTVVVSPSLAPSSLVLRLISLDPPLLSA